jgi:hypothetical protein
MLKVVDCGVALLAAGGVAAGEEFPAPQPAVMVTHAAAKIIVRK